MRKVNESEARAKVEAEDMDVTTVNWILISPTTIKRKRKLNNRMQKRISKHNVCVDVEI